MALRRNIFYKSVKSRPFIMRINSGVDSQITIPTSGGGYNYYLRVQGGQAWYGLTGNHTINFPSANTDYVIEISGEFPNIYLGANLSNAIKVKEIISYGDVKTKSLFNAYRGTNITFPTTESMDLELVTNGDLAFRDSIFSSVNIINTHNITIFISFFEGTSDFDFDISSMDFSSATNMNLFLQSSQYSKPVVLNNTNNVTTMYRIIRLSKVPFFKMDASSVVITSDAFNSSYLTGLELDFMKTSFSIQYSTALTGSAIDNLFTSLGTANTGATITISTAQNTSGIDTTIATSKGWTIIVL